MNNTGGVPIESMALVLTDTVTGAAAPLFSDTFINQNGCNLIDRVDVIQPGAAQIVSSPVFGYDPTGHALRATIILCSGPGRTGMCETKVVNFTP